MTRVRAAVFLTASTVLISALVLEIIGTAASRPPSDHVSRLITAERARAQACWKNGFVSGKLAEVIVALRARGIHVSKQDADQAWTTAPPECR